jgi:hypothetical protein
MTKPSSSSVLLHQIGLTASSAAEAMNHHYIYVRMYR